MARPTVGPPSIQLRSNLANIVSAELLQADDKYVLSFKKITDIHNTTESDVITINSDAKTAGGLSVGQRYIVAYIAWESLRQPKVVRSRPGGPVLMSMTGAEPAIFLYDKDVENLLRWDLDESLNSPKDMLPVIMRGIQHADDQVQNFFTAEVVLRTNMYKHFHRTDKAVLWQHFLNPLTTDRTKQLMLSNHDFLKAIEADSIQLCGELENILTFTSVDLNPLSRSVGLIRAALTHVSKCQQLSDLAVVSRWVLSDVPSVIEAALASLYQLKKGSDLDAVEMALQQTMLKAQSREVLYQHKKRMKRTGQ